MSRDRRFLPEYDRIMAETTEEERAGFPVVADRVRLFKEIGRLRATVERYRKVLEWYADSDKYESRSWDKTADYEMYYDRGQRAQEALKEQEE